MMATREVLTSDDLLKMLVQFVVFDWKLFLAGQFNYRD